MGDDCSAGQLTGWLQKKKSGSSKLRVRQYNKRYFTLDFDSQTFFYAHSEGSDKTSLVAHFSDIADVRLPEADRGDNASQCSNASKGSFLRRMSNTLGGSKDNEEHIIVLLIRPAKQMELLCSSLAEALQWSEALKAAMTMDRSQMTAVGEGALNDDDDEESKNGGSPNGGMAAAAAAGATEAAFAGDSLGQEEAEIDAPPPPARGTFLNFGLDPVQEDGGPGSNADAIEEGVRQGEETTIVEAAPTALQASDFGFGDGEDSSSCSSSAPSSPRGAETLQEDSAVQDQASPSAAAPSVAPAAPGAYGDRHEGLSMQERLANLEFSDDEEADDDDPLGLGSSKVNADSP
eukprot:TRINITY_DN9095_c0_g5_i1.p1 TRINITY_DN9095_c0_g5~~TRINITY_DN9095_c0_g5_i1.p1  ORF type:complete len:348 (+),score=103.12 TRINITY_DN9095_c0_g5_i1:129-1172(+)